MKAARGFKQWRRQHFHGEHLPAGNLAAKIWLHKYKWKAIVKEHSDVPLIVWGGSVGWSPWSAFAVHCVGNVPRKQLWTKQDIQIQVWGWRVFPVSFQSQWNTPLRTASVAPLPTTQQWLATTCEKSLQCLCREEKYEHSIFCHRDTAECKPLKWFLCWPFTFSDIRLP